MIENQNAETVLSEHDESICSGGVTMCHECYAAGSDAGDAAEQDQT